jgi:O-antigen ligase
MQPVRRRGRVLVALPRGVGIFLVAVPLALAALAVAFVVGDFWRLLFLATLAAVAGYLVIRPHWGALAMGAFWMIGLDPVRIGPLKTVELLALVLLIPLAMDVSRQRGLWILRVPHMWIVLGIGLVLIAATVWSELLHPPPPHEVFELTAVELRHFAKNLLILVFLATFIREPRHIVCAAGVLLLVILLFAYEALDPLGGGPADRRVDASGMADPNRLGALCVWGTALFWSLRFHARARLPRMLALVPLILLPFVAMLTASRSAFIQLILLAGLILLAQRHWSPVQRVRGVALILTIALVIVVAAPNAALLRVTSYGSDVGDPGWHSTRARTHGLAAGLVMAAEHPVFGVGPGNFRWRIGQNVGPHNSYLWALTSGGPALLVLYLLLLHRTYRGFRVAEQAGPAPLVWVATGLRLSLISFLVLSFFADVWLQHPLYWFVAMSIALARQVPAGAVAPAGARLGAPARTPA